jgi:hypothetical protein
MRFQFISKSDEIAVKLSAVAEELRQGMPEFQQQMFREIDIRGA